MAKNKTLAYGLILVGLLIALLLSPLGSGLIDRLPNILERGKSVECTVSVDAGLSPSINSVSCSGNANACQAPLGLLGWFDNPFTSEQRVEMLYAGQLVDSVNYEINNLGVNQDKVLNGCLPNDATTVRINLKNDAGAVVDTASGGV